MPWVYVLLAGLTEIAWATGLKYSEGFSRLWPSAFTIVTMVVSFWLLSLAMRALPLGTAYAVWTGIGAVGSFAVGILLFGESASFWRLFSAGLVLAGIVGLKLSS
ncbi:quaternary ammonium compound efflux SMR transporter SugE [Cupriavidus gilardii]|uniref:quaternary ammonium compound efflux SMR transporter SugE n=1 Tax=Cupriavidus gilardii TaxID=82541 RepID=UPI0007E2EEF8|nr:quaternary ammonium compound efflux SMR transporter SugE [Cupriavidus gilardii]